MFAHENMRNCYCVFCLYKHWKISKAICRWFCLQHVACPWQCGACINFNQPHSDDGCTTNTGFLCRIKLPPGCPLETPFWLQWHFSLAPERHALSECALGGLNELYVFWVCLCSPCLLFPFCLHSFRFSLFSHHLWRFPSFICFLPMIYVSVYFCAWSGSV